MNEHQILPFEGRGTAPRSGVVEGCQRPRMYLMR